MPDRLLGDAPVRRQRSRPPTATGPDTHPSQLLEPLLEGWDDRLSVLDLGAAVPETVDFFADRRCRLQFVDLVGEIEAAKAKDPTAPVSVAPDAVAGMLDFAPDTRFDVCLFWDLLNYLDTVTLGMFCRFLAPYLHDNTRAHGFGVFKGTTDLPDQIFGIRGATEIVARPRADGLRPAQHHSQRALAQALTTFDIRRTTLSNVGRLEFLMVRND